MARSQSRPKSKPSGDWAALLSAVVSQKGRSPAGQGWKTVEQIRREYGIGKDTAYSLVNTLMKRGRVEHFSGSEKVGRTLVRRSWYRIKK